MKWTITPKRTKGLARVFFFFFLEKKVRSTFKPRKVLSFSNCFSLFDRHCFLKKILFEKKNWLLSFFILVILIFVIFLIRSTSYSYSSFLQVRLILFIFRFFIIFPFSSISFHPKLLRERNGIYIYLYIYCK